MTDFERERQRLWSDTHKSGELVYAMSQSHTMAWWGPGPWGNIHRGFCLGLAVRWIWLRHGNEDYPLDPGTPTSVFFPDWQATRDQTLYMDAQEAARRAGGKYTFESTIMPVLQNYGMILNPGRTFFRSWCEPGTPCEWVAEAGKGCYLVSLRAPFSAHAVAMQNEGGDVFRLFDANAGEFRLRGKRPLLAFFTRYLENLYDRQYHDVRMLDIAAPLGNHR